MVKRKDRETDDLPSAKRARCEAVDRLSVLSDEILLHILDFLPVTSLITCQRLSRRFHALAGDSEVWKRKYYNRWVWPRAQRLRRFSLKQTGLKAADFSPDVSRWLEHGRYAMMDAQDKSWKNQYRLRQNWSTGICRVKEIEVAPPPFPFPPTLVKLENGIVFTADTLNGLRAWSIKDPEVLLAHLPFDGVNPTPVGLTSETPSAISVAPHPDRKGDFEIVVGFENGALHIYSLELGTASFTCRYSERRHAASPEGSITALASSPPYTLVLTRRHMLCLYRSERPDAESPNITRLQLVTSLDGFYLQDPLSLSVRRVSGEIIASVAYSFYRIGIGCSLGVQELRVNEKGETLGSRVATTVDAQFSTADVGFHRPRAPGYPPTPTSLSYSHPYLISSHPDNTLSMYLVSSTSEELAVKGGRRLFGHTTSVAGVRVSNRGKAVSVSSKGRHIRVWDLEGVLSTGPSAKWALKYDTGILLNPEGRPREMCLPLGIGCGSLVQRDDVDVLGRQDLVGFDDEQVVIREHEAGRQILGSYYFA